MKPLPESCRWALRGGDGDVDETVLVDTVEASEAVVASDTVERPSESGRRVGGREIDLFLVMAELDPEFLVLSSHESDLFLGGLPRIVRAMAVSCCRCCSYCDNGSKGRRAGGACFVLVCDFLIL